IVLTHHSGGAWVRTLRVPVRPALRSKAATFVDRSILSRQRAAKQEDDEHHRSSTLTCANSPGPTSDVLVAHDRIIGAPAPIRSLNLASTEIRSISYPMEQTNLPGMSR